MKPFLAITLGLTVVLFGLMPGPVHATTAESARTRAIVEQLFEAFNRHDLDAVVALYADNAKLVTPSFVEPRYGLEVVREEYKGHFDNIPGVHD